MSENEIQRNDVTDIEIQPLSDEALEDVAGGAFADQVADGSSSCCSCYLCTC
jgi:hypothetical protein